MKLRTNLLFLMSLCLSFLFGCSNETVRFQSTCFNNEPNPNPNEVGVWMYQAGSWHEGRKDSSAWLALHVRSKSALSLSKEPTFYQILLFGSHLT
jgi:hypothetical protein